MDIVHQATAEQFVSEIPEFRVGDTVAVHVRVIEGDKERIQVFEGVCIKFNGSGISKTFTVRKVTHGVGVERIFPFHSPRIAELKLIRKGHIRRSKLYYLRDLRGKAARIKEKAVTR